MAVRGTHALAALASMMAMARAGQRLRLGSGQEVVENTDANSIEQSGSVIIAAPARWLGERAGGSHLGRWSLEPAREERPDPEMAGLAPFGFGDDREIPSSLRSGRAVTAVTAENAPVLDRKLSCLVEDERFWNDMVELDDLAGDIEAAAFAADAAALIHGSLEHGDLLAAGELATATHHAASSRP